MLVRVAGAVCLFGTWVGMRHFARARATEGTDPQRLAVHGFRRHRRGAVGLDLHFDSRARSVAEQRLRAGRNRRGSVIAIVACLIGFEIGSRHFTLAPEAGGLVMGVGILAMHFVAIQGLAYRRQGRVERLRRRDDAVCSGSASARSPSTAPTGR